jgi:hypothetical protein
VTLLVLFLQRILGVLGSRVLDVLDRVLIGVLSRFLPPGTEENHEELHSG